MDGRPGGILERVAHRISHHGGPMGLGPLAAELTGLDILLGVVPGASAVVHERGDQDAADRPDHEKCRDAFCSHAEWPAWGRRLRGC